VLPRTLVGCLVWAGLVFTAACSTAPEQAAHEAGGEKQKIREFWGSYRQATRLRLDGRYAEAIALFRKCLQLDPEHEDSLYYLGASLEHLGRYREALKAYQRLIGVNPQSGRALAQLVELLSTPLPGAPVDYEQAEKWALQWVEVNREQAGPFLQQGLLELNRGRFAKAAEHFQVAVRSGSPEGFAWAGYTAWLRGLQGEALKMFRGPIEIEKRERRLAGAGIKAEGDILPEPGKPLSALDRAALVSLFFSRVIQGGGKAFPALFRPANAGLAAAGRGAWGDYDGDGGADLAVAGKALTLYRNAGGRFLDVTAATGLPEVKGVECVLWADYDGDGRLDLYAGGRSGARLFRNLGGSFSEVTGNAGLGRSGPADRAVFADIDGDGDVDLLQSGPVEGGWAVQAFLNAGGAFSKPDRPVIEVPAAVTRLRAADLDGDGHPELIVAVWENGIRVLARKPDGRWTEKTAAAGLNQTPSAVTDALLFDYDRDGDADLLLAVHAPWEDALRSLLQPEFRSATSASRLYRNDGGRFQDVSEAVGITASYGVMEALAADLDGDGWQDVILVNGGYGAQRVEPTAVLRNEGGKRLRLWSRLPGAGNPGNYIAASVADYNGDGRPDLFLARNPRFPARLFPAGVFRNVLQ